MSRILSFLLLTGLAASVTAQDLVSVTPQTFEPANILQLALPIPTEFDVQTYKVVYTTRNADGETVTVSGMLAVPQANEALPLAAYMHGTAGTRTAVPSRITTQERLLVSALATSGYITVAPDYIGLGDSELRHPYVHAETQANAGRDMIVALRPWLDDEGIARKERVYVTGYSQGGHAAAALHRDLELNPGTDSITVASASHLSGPYSISEVMVGTLFDTTTTLPGYLAYTYISYNGVYGLFDSLEQVFVPPYLDPIRRFDNLETELLEFNFELEQLLEENDADLTAIFQDSIVATLRAGDPNSPIIQALRDNDTFDWAPSVPTLIYYCTEDEQVPFRNAILADSVMRANGSTSVILENGGPRSHGACVIPAMTRTIAFFDRVEADILSSTPPVLNRPEVVFSPNPVRILAGARVRGLGQEQCAYTWHDALGRRLAAGQLTLGGDLRVPATLSPGLHFLTLELPEGRLVRRVMVRR